ncbi:Serine/threonine-protein phosphatase 2A activator 1 [Nakaseomyces bracarensis]|uniref:Serine/threonine-protein phosphatase 2A activator n=1 Tax=Nakaseomyces bracarensis TaxID=273131 RepID=A0ABR4NUY2_9SACH
MEGGQFTEPLKRIYDSQGTLYFQSSEALRRLELFIGKYIDLVESLDIPQELPLRGYEESNDGGKDDGEVSITNIMREFVEILERLDQLLTETPPLPGPRRFGNMACRDWHVKIDKEIPLLLTNLLKNYFPKYEDAQCELTYYLKNSFGSATRLDFGTGHELSFVATIAALEMLGAQFNGDEFLYIYNKYCSLVHRLILTYTLEPAGSHGVWGLDDHFHLAYILGSSQWCSRKTLAMLPDDLNDNTLVKKYSSTNLFCKTLNFVFTVKSGPFREHSPMLYDISKTVRSWPKVKKGLWKMYKEEVLNKFPVVQHFWFGTGFYPWIDQRTHKPLPNYENSPDIDDINMVKDSKGTRSFNRGDLGHVVDSRLLAGNDTFLKRPHMNDTVMTTRRNDISTPSMTSQNFTKMGPPSMKPLTTRCPPRSASQLQRDTPN